MCRRHRALGRYLNGLIALNVVDEINSRLDYLRRNSSLDSKTGLFYLQPPASENALYEFFRTYSLHSL